MYLAAEAGEMDVVCSLVEYCKCNSTRADFTGRTPFLAAVRFQHWDVALFLLKHGLAGVLPLTDVAPLIYSDDGWTPLHWAAAVGDLVLLNALLAGGADISLRGPCGLTPCALAQIFEQNDAAAILKAQSISTDN